MNKISHRPVSGQDLMQSTDHRCASDSRPIDDAVDHRLLKAAWDNDLGLLQLLLEKGASPNSADQAGNTALMLAAARGHPVVVRALCAAGASIHARNRAGNTALHLAAEHGHADMVRELCELGADIHTRNAMSCTALQWAVLAGSLVCRNILMVVRDQERLQGDQQSAPGLAVPFSTHGSLRRVL